MQSLHPSGKESFARIHTCVDIRTCARADNEYSDDMHLKDLRCGLVRRVVVEVVEDDEAMDEAIEDFDDLLLEAQDSHESRWA